MDLSATQPQGLSPTAAEVFGLVCAALAAAEGIGGPEGDDYAALMQAISEEALKRRETFLGLQDGAIAVIELTEVQAQVLGYVRAYRAVHQMPPTRAEISRHFGWKSDNAADFHLHALQRKGAIRLSPHSRGIFDLETARSAP